MKKIVLQVESETEKVQAIRFYLDNKEGSLESELTDYVETLYKKYVPVQVRDYIEKAEMQGKNVSPKPSRKQTAKNGDFGAEDEKGINTRTDN